MSAQVPIPVSSDARHTSRFTLFGVAVTATTSLAVATISAAVTVYVTNNHSADEKSTDRLSVAIDPLEENLIGFPYQSLTGHVAGLQVGQSVWTFSRFASSNDKNKAKKFYPNNGPCRVNVDYRTWICPDMTIGDYGAVGDYQIWVTVVNDSQALDIVKKITCAENATLPPIGDPPEFPMGCDASVSDIFPPTQQNVADYITARRAE